MVTRCWERVFLFPFLCSLFCFPGTKLFSSGSSESSVVPVQIILVEFGPCLDNVGHGVAEFAVVFARVLLGAPHELVLFGILKEEFHSPIAELRILESSD